MTEQQLPQLPEPHFTLRWYPASAVYKVSKPNVGTEDCYTADQMRAYAIAAVAAERERCAQIAEAMRPHGGRMWDEAQMSCHNALTDCAMHIRNGLTIKEPSNV
jgi:hypothetical protein